MDRGNQSRGRAAKTETVLEVVRYKRWDGVTQRKENAARAGALRRLKPNPARVDFGTEQLAWSEWCRDGCAGDRIAYVANRLEMLKGLREESPE